MLELVPSLEMVATADILGFFWCNCGFMVDFARPIGPR